MSSGGDAQGFAGGPVSFGFSPMGASRESQSSQVRKSITISVTGHALLAREC